MRMVRLGLAAGMMAILAGCHSAYIDATVSNHTSTPIRLVEVDYPSASFGVQTLAPGQDFHYRFKVLGSGDLTLLYTDAATHDHKDKGPALYENDEGKLTVVVGPGGTEWREQLTNRH